MFALLFFALLLFGTDLSPYSHVIFVGLIAMHLKGRFKFYWLFFCLVALVLVLAVPSPSWYADDVPLRGYLYRVQDQTADGYFQRDGKWLKLRVISTEPLACENGTPLVVPTYEVLKESSSPFVKTWLGKGYKGAIQVGQVNPLALRVKPPRVQHVGAWIEKFIMDEMATYQADTQTLMRALLLGYLPSGKAWVEDAKAMGLLHLFVVSGFHFTVILGFVSLLLNKGLKGHYRLCVGLSLVIMAVFTCAVGLQISALRAFIMLMVPMLAFFTKRKMHTLELLMMIASGWLVLQPQVRHVMGFQLSFYATALVLLVTETRFYKKVPSKMLQMGFLSLVIIMALWPLLALHGQTMHVSQVILLVFMTPLVSAYLLLIPLAILLARLPVLRFVFVALMEAGSEVIYDALRLLKDGLVLPMPQHALLVFLVFWGLGLGLFFMMRPFYGGSKVTKCATCLVLLACVLFDTVEWGTTLHVFDLKDGESYLLRSGQGQVLYDVGNDPHLLNRLKALGVVSLDAVIISHAHEDHMGLLPDLVKAFRVDRVITSPRDKLVLGPAFEVAFYQNQGGSLNDRSLVADIKVQGHRLLFTGDLEDEGGLWLQEKVGGQVEIFKVPHHGSYVTNLPGLLRAYAPDLALIGGGRGKGIDKNPSKEDLNDFGIPFYDTMIDGEIIINWSPIHDVRSIVTNQ